MKLIAITCLLVSSALPIKSDAFPIIHHDVHDITRHHSQRTVNPTSSVLGRRKNAKTPVMFALPPSSLSSLFDGNFSSSSDSDNMRGLMAIRGGDTTSPTSSLVDKTKAFVSKNFFLLGMVVAVSLAKLFPEVCVTTLLLYTLS